MRTTRSFLLLGACFLVLASLSGCMQLPNLQSQPPQALFTATPVEHVVPFTASFDGTLSSNPDGQTLSYLWTFGDGGSESGALVDHTFTRDGVFEVRLTVIDEQGLATSSTLTVRALNPLPTASFAYSPKSIMEENYIVSASEWITFDGTASTDDGEVASYRWNFGDGKVDDGPVVEHRWLWAGTYNVVLTVTDNDGDESNTIQQIRVLGGPPCNADIEGNTQWNSGGYVQ